MIPSRTFILANALMLALANVLAWPARSAEAKQVPAPAAAIDRTANAANSESQPARSGAEGDQALTELEKTAQRTGADPAAWISLGNALMQRSRENLDTRLYGRAEAAFEKALALSPKDTEALVGMAWVHNSEHQFDEGRRWAEKALAIDPKLQHAHALLGDAAVELGQYDTAYEHYQEALDIRPDLSSYSRAAHLLWLTGDSRKARWLMQKAIAAGAPHPENTAWCRAELARMLWHNGALLAAEQEAEKAFKMAPANPHVLATVGLIKASKSDYAGAIDYYTRAVAVMPSHDALVALGDLYLHTGREDEARLQFDRVVALHTDSLIHSHGGSVHRHDSTHGNAQLAHFYADHDRNLDEALREAETAYRTYKNVFVADTLAWCYYKKGLYDQARKTILKALHWKTPDANILFHAGLIFEKVGDRTAAKNYLYRALSLNPHFHLKHAALASNRLKELSEPVQGKGP